MTSLDVLRVSRVVPAPPDRVFRAWTTPDDMKRWFGRPEGFDVSNVEIDLRVGGRYRIETELGNARAVCVGTYHVVDPSHTLSFSFSWETPLVPDMETGDTVVTVEFRPVNDETEVVITHERLRDGTMFFHQLGWQSTLERLEACLREEGEKA